MAIKRMDHVGIVVSDLDAATAFFVELGFEEQGSGRVGGDLVARIVGLPGVQSDFAMLKTPDGLHGIELIRFVSPSVLDGASQAPANSLGLRHVCFEVDDIHDVVGRLEQHGGELIGEIVDYEGFYLLCYLRGPEGIIVELAQAVGASEQAQERLTAHIR
ncbi:MAG: VOC family protein [Solirubrobacteraceae bacterium]|nr:VOC family protein [Solirubrobacteraceae bacterium]